MKKFTMIATTALITAAIVSAISFYKAQQIAQLADDVSEESEQLRGALDRCRFSESLKKSSLVDCRDQVDWCEEEIQRLSAEVQTAHVAEILEVKN